MIIKCRRLGVGVGGRTVVEQQRCPLSSSIFFITIPLKNEKVSYIRITKKDYCQKVENHAPPPLPLNRKLILLLSSFLTYFVFKCCQKINFVSGGRMSLYWTCNCTEIYLREKTMKKYYFCKSMIIMLIYNTTESYSYSFQFLYCN